MMLILLQFCPLSCYMKPIRWFPLFIAYILLGYGADHTADLAVYTLNDASNWTGHYW